LNKKKEKIKLGPDSVTHKRFLDCTSDYVIFGGGAGCGKSHQALLKVLKYKDDPNFRGIFIRETSVQLSQAGGLYQEAEKMWSQFGAKFKTHPTMTATFPSGAQVQFKVCGADRDITNFDGGQFSLVVFDEAQNHTDVQIRYLESRIRSQAKGPHQLICTCNPRRDSHLMPFVSWYLDQETGIPIPERSGVERYYASYCGSMVFGDTKEELLEKYPGVSPQTYVFISATIKDNPRMKVLNPGYVARLENLKRVERERLLLGSWFAKQESQGLFRRSWCEIVDCVPAKVTSRHRGMDLASTLASESNPNPDWTASVRISKSEGYYYVEHVERYRELTHSVLEHIAETSKKDYHELGVKVPVTIPKDPGAAAAAANMFFVKTLVENGVDVRSEGVSGHTGKLARMQPFLSLAEAGWVRVVKGDWNEMWFNELEDYIDGNRNQKDDMWDATASAAKAVMKNNTMPSFAIPLNTQPSPIPSL
jgi:predicted phage terminase large subunit-like protein